MRIIRLFVVIGALFWGVQCATVPVTGRKQLLIYPETEMVQLSLTSYRDFLKANKLSVNVQDTRRVKEVGRKIAAAVEAYLESQGLVSGIEDFDWEFNLVQSQEMNAWCMPGGKVVFYEGILPVCQNDAGIAVVMGHEIAHAIARHGNERMSQQMLLEAGSAAAAYALKNKSETVQSVFSTAVGLGSNYGIILPFSRKQESEADRLGLIFMAIAGYDPREAIAFWTRMADVSGGEKGPEFMSTHPSDVHRIEKLKEFIPEAMSYVK